MKKKLLVEGHTGVLEDVTRAAHFFDICTEQHNQCHKCPEAINCAAIWDTMVNRDKGKSTYTVEIGIKPPLMIREEEDNE